MTKVETILVSFNPTEKVESAVLLVGKQTPGMYPEIINAFQGKEAVELYNKLITKKTEGN
jgi:hypothetical protein